MQCSTFSKDDSLSGARKEIHLINKVDLLGRHALFFDFDGTLVDFGIDPDKIKVPPRRIFQLRHVFEKIRSMAIVSGRSPDELDHFLRPLVLPTAGVHGAEIRFNNRVKLLTSNTLLKPLAEELLRLGCEYPDIYLEKKGERAIAVHYRRVPERGLLIGELIDRLIQRCSWVEVILGKYFLKSYLRIYPKVMLSVPLCKYHHSGGAVLCVLVMMSPMSLRLRWLMRWEE